jgi:hypothetical protein
MRAQHVGDLRGIVGVVAIHDDEDVVVGGVADGIVDERAQTRAQALVDHAVEDQERQPRLPVARDGNCRVGAAVVVKHDGDGLPRRFDQPLHARQQPRQRDLLVVGGQTDKDPAGFCHRRGVIP